MCWGKKSTKSALDTVNLFPRWNNPNKRIFFFLKNSQENVICEKRFVEPTHKALSNKDYATASLR